MRRLAPLLLAPLLAGCNGLFYYPDHVEYSRPADLGPRVEDVTFTSHDGTRLDGWFIPARAPRKGTVVQFHGNAQNLTSHVEFVAWLADAGYDVFAFDYPGYGRSDGEPTRDGTVLAGAAALSYVRSRPDVDPSRVLVLGQSLGGAVALATVGEGPPGLVRGVAVDATFASYQHMGNEVLGGHAITYPLAWLLLGSAHDPEDTLDQLPPTPLLVLHGDADRVVPFEEGERLFDEASPPKQFVPIAGADHLQALGTVAGRRALLTFFERCLAGAPSAGAGK
jgi:fermentation-respiration switch protein FrsA (DUF1100 family)